MMHKSIPILILSSALLALPASARDGRDLAGAFLGGLIVGEIVHQASRPVERTYYSPPPARVYYDEAPRVYYSEPTTVYYSAPPVVHISPSVRYIEHPRGHWRNEWRNERRHRGHRHDW